MLGSVPKKKLLATPETHFNKHDTTPLAKSVKALKKVLKFSIQ